MTPKTSRPIGRPFKPGQSGNPAGRPRSAGRIAELREKLGTDIDAVIGEVVRQAKAGDLTAARIVIERLIPAAKPVVIGDPPLSMPAGDASEKAAAVAQAVAAGDMQPDRAAAVLGAIRAAHDLGEAEELRKRVERLEASLRGPEGVE